MKINYNEVKKKVIDREGGENRSDMYKWNWKGMVDEVVDCGVLN